MEDVILYNESVNEVYVEGAISFVEKLKRLWKAFLDLLKRIKIKLKMVFNKDMRQFNKFKYIINSPDGHEKEIDILKNTMCDKWDTDYTKKLFAKCNELCTLILDFKFKIGPMLAGNRAYDVSGIESLFNKLETVNDEIKQMAKNKPVDVIKDGWSKYDAIKTLIEEEELMREYFIHFDDVERFCGDIDYAINHNHGAMTRETVDSLTKLVKLWTNSFTHIRDVFDITSHVSSAIGFDNSKNLSTIMHQHTDDSGRMAKIRNQEFKEKNERVAAANRAERERWIKSLENEMLKDMEDARKRVKAITKKNDEPVFDSAGFTDHDKYVMREYDRIFDNLRSATLEELEWMNDHTDEYYRLLRRIGINRPHSEYYTKGVNNMEDVILYNESWDIDKLSPYNTFYMEGSIGDKLKHIIDRIVIFIRGIIEKIRGRFAEARIKRYKQMVKDPDTVERLKKHEVAKWDTELNKKFFDVGFDIIEYALQAFGEVISEQSTRNIDKHLKFLEKKKEYVKALVTETRAVKPNDEKWSEYDALNALIEESAHAAQYAFVLNSFAKLIESNRRGKLESLYGVEGVSKEKVLELFILTSDIMKIYSEGGMNVNAYYGGTAINAGAYRGGKSFDKFSKKTRDAIKKAGGKPGPINMVRINSVKQESYMEGMNGMDVILYNDNTDSQVTTESAVEEKEPLTLEEVDAYIESVMDDLNEAMDLRSRMIQESDDAAADTSSSSSDADTSSDDGVDSPDTVEEGCSAKKDTKKSQPVKESYVLDGSAIFGESYNHMDDVENNLPSRFAQEAYIRQLDIELDDVLTEEEFFDESYVPDFYKESSYLGATVAGSVIGFALGSAISAGIIAIDKLITDKKYGRFPKDMKAAYEIIRTEGFEASDKTKALKKAFRKLNADLVYMLAGFGSRWKLTVDEAHEVKKLKDYVDDLYTRGWMLTKNKEKSDKRRVPERIEAFVKQGNKVLEILSKSVYKSDVVREYMS